MAQLLRSITVILLFGSVITVAAGTARAQGGDWSNHAAAVPGNRTFKVPSPDRRRTIVIDNNLLSVWEAGGGVVGGEGIDVLRSAEVLWSPDSQAFAVTASDGSAAGGWDISVFLFEHDRCNFYSLTDEAAERFQELHLCGGGERPNIGAVKWTKGSKQLLIAVEVPPASSCRDRGVYAGYLIEVPSGKVTRVYDRQQLGEEWGESLGRRFPRRAP